MAKQTLNPRHDYGDIVYLKTDPNGYEYLVTGYLLVPNGWMYRLSCCGEEGYYYSFEIADVPPESFYGEEDDEEEE